MYGCILFFSFCLILLYFYRGLFLHFFVFFSSFSFQHYLSLLFFFYLASFKIILYFLSVYLSFTVFFNNFSLNLPSPKSYLSFLLTPSFQASLTFKLFLLPIHSISSCLPALLPSIPSSHLLLLFFFLPAAFHFLLNFSYAFFIPFFFFFYWYFLFIVCSVPLTACYQTINHLFFNLYIRVFKKLFLLIFESLSLVQTIVLDCFSYWLLLFKHFHAHL